MTDAPRRRALVPALMALLFFGPLAVATLLYYYGGDYWRPRGTTAHGVLLAEPRSLPADARIPSADGDHSFTGHWTLIYVDDGRCADACREGLYRTRQVRRALGKEMGRVQRVFVALGAGADAAYLAAEHPGLAVLGPDSPLQAGVLAALAGYQPGEVFVADPIGNVILRFPAGTPMKDMHADLNLLLKASHIG